MFERERFIGGADGALEIRNSLYCTPKTLNHQSSACFFRCELKCCIQSGPFAFDLVAESFPNLSERALARRNFCASLLFSWREVVRPFFLVIFFWTLERLCAILTGFVRMMEKTKENFLCDPQPFRYSVSAAPCSGLVLGFLNGPWLSVQSVFETPDVFFYNCASVHWSRDIFTKSNTPMMKYSLTLFR